MTLAFDCTTTSIRFSCRKGSRRLRIGLPGMPLGGASSQVVLPDGSREDVVWTQGRRIKGSTTCEDTPPNGIPGSSIRRCRLPFRNEKRIEAVVKSKASVMVLGDRKSVV